MRDAALMLGHLLCSRLKVRCHRLRLPRVLEDRPDGLDELTGGVPGPETKMKQEGEMSGRGRMRGNRGWRNEQTMNEKGGRKGETERADEQGSNEGGARSGAVVCGNDSDV